MWRTKRENYYSKEKSWPAHKRGKSVAKEWKVIKDKLCSGLGGLACEYAKFPYKAGCLLRK
jgi:hypothetical protein